MDCQTGKGPPPCIWTFVASVVCWCTYSIFNDSLHHPYICECFCRKPFYSPFRIGRQILCACTILIKCNTGHKTVVACSLFYIVIVSQSISAWSTFALNHLRQNFRQVINVSATFCTVHSLPKRENALDELFFVLWLYLSMLFHFMPHVLYWVTVWGLRWGMPPVDSMVDEELSSLGKCMLGIIILNESVPI